VKSSPEGDYRGNKSSRSDAKIERARPLDAQGKKFKSEGKKENYRE
jgi:hypothetical protein